MLSLEVVTLLSPRRETVVFHLARVALQLTVVSRTLGLSNVMSIDVLNTPSVDFHISILCLLMQVLLLKNTCTSAFGVNKLDVLPQLAVVIRLHYTAALSVQVTPVRL